MHLSPTTSLQADETQGQPFRKASPGAQGFAWERAHVSNWPIRAFSGIFLWCFQKDANFSENTCSGNRMKPDTKGQADPRQNQSLCYTITFRLNLPEAHPMCGSDPGPSAVIQSLVCLTTI